MHTSIITILYPVLLFVYTPVAISDDEDERFHLNIPSSSLHDSLIELAAQIQYEILFGVESVPKIKSIKLQGEFTVDKALEKLLDSSNLHYTLSNQQIRIFQPRLKSTHLPTVTVFGYLRSANLRISHNETSQDSFPLHQIPLSIQSISRDHMDDVQAFDIKDALTYANGIEYFSLAGGINPKYYSRGIETPFSIDGKYYRRTILVLDPSVVERIDLIQGPSISFLEPGGLINFVTKKPKKSRHRELTFTTGSDDLYRTEMDINISNTHNKSLRIIATVQKKNHIKKFAFNNKVVLASSASFEFSNKTHLLLSSYYKTEEKYPNTQTYHESVLNKRLPREQTMGAPWAKSTIRDSFIAADLTNVQFSSWLVNGGINWNISDTNNTFTSVLDNVSAEGNAALIQLNVKGIVNKAYGFDIAAERKAFLFKHPILLRFGLDYQHYNQHNPIYGQVQFIGKFNIYQPNYDFKQPKRPEQSGVLDQINDFTGLFFAQSFYLPHNITLHSDFRYEIMKIDGELEDQIPNVITGEITTTHWKSTKQYRELTPQLGLNLPLYDSLSTHISYSESFSYQTTFLANKISDANIFETHYVSPIRNQQVELSLKKTWRNEHLFGNLTLYHLKRSNIITLNKKSAPTIQESPSNNQTLFENTPASDETSEGLSISLSGQISSKLNIISNINYNHNTTSTQQAAGSIGGLSFSTPANKTNNRAQATAQLNANAWLNYDIQFKPFRDFKFGFGIKYVGKKYGDRENNFTLPAYTKFDTFITYNRWKSLSLGFSIRNITDKYYYESSLGKAFLIEEGDFRSFYLTVKSSSIF